MTHIFNKRKVIRPMGNTLKKTATYALDESLGFRPALNGGHFLTTSTISAGSSFSAEPLPTHAPLAGS